MVAEHRSMVAEQGCRSPRHIWRCWLASTTMHTSFRCRFRGVPIFLGVHGFSMQLCRTFSFTKSISSIHSIFLSYLWASCFLIYKLHWVACISTEYNCQKYDTQVDVDCHDRYTAATEARPSKTSDQQAGSSSGLWSFSACTRIANTCWCDRVFLVGSDVGLLISRLRVVAESS